MSNRRYGNGFGALRGVGALQSVQDDDSPRHLATAQMTPHPARLRYESFKNGNGKYQLLLLGEAQAKRPREMTTNTNEATTNEAAKQSREKRETRQEAINNTN